MADVRARLYIALAVNVGNLGPTSRPRIPMSDWMKKINANLRGQSGSFRVADWFGHTGNFIVVSTGASSSIIAECLSSVLATTCTLVPVPELKQHVASLRELPAPLEESGIRWTPGAVFHVLGPTALGDPSAALHATFRRLTPSVIAAWKRDYLNSGRRLDKDRRAGGWGAVATMIKRQMGGRWTARSISTLDGALRRAEEIHSWFTEWFDPADLKEARALLEELT